MQKSSSSFEGNKINIIKCLNKNTIHIHRSIPSILVNRISSIHYIKWVLTIENGFFGWIIITRQPFLSLSSDGENLNRLWYKRREKKSWHWMTFRIWNRIEIKLFCVTEKLLHCIYFVSWCTTSSLYKLSFPLSLQNIHLKSKHLILRIYNDAHYWLLFQHFFFFSLLNLLMLIRRPDLKNDLWIIRPSSQTKWATLR